jgi:hypothetical protein
MPATNVAQPVGPGRLPFAQWQPVVWPLTQLEAPLVSLPDGTSEAQATSPSAHSQHHNSPERALRSPKLARRIRTLYVCC